MDYEDLNLRPTSHEDSPIILSVPVENSHNDWLKIAGAVLLVVAVAATGYLVFRNRQAAAPASAPAATTSSARNRRSKALGADGPAIDLPPLNESDDVVRGLVKELSSNPSVAAWLMTDNLIRNFTVVVSNIAAGEPAARQVTVLRPKGASRSKNAARICSSTRVATPAICRSPLRRRRSIPKAPPSSTRRSSRASTRPTPSWAREARPSTRRSNAPSSCC